MITVDKLTGEVLPDASDFIYFEVSAFTTNGFRRNLVVPSTYFPQWRKEYNNTGIFRSMLRSNCPDLAKWDDESTLFYGNLCFDMDVSKDVSPIAWKAMIEEVERALVPALCRDFGIPTTDIQFWFSGARGLHIEVPAELIGAWPVHDLNRIYNYYAKDLVVRNNLEFVDLSLYGFKHPYRLEGSVHQRSGFYKYPLSIDELVIAKDYDYFTKTYASKARRSASWTKRGSAKASHFYATMVKTALDLKRETPEVTSGSDRQMYDRSRYRCVETMLSDDYLISQGSRQTMVYFYAAHLAQHGFAYDEAESEMAKLTTDHCDPPYTTKSNEAEVERTLSLAYEPGAKRAGCSYIQRNIPSLCEESKCPLGKYLIAQRKSRT
jgi:hypothetical protein